MYNIILLLILVYLICEPKGEKYTYTDTTKPIHRVVFDDPAPNMSEYREVGKIELNNDIVEKLVLVTNKYIRDKAGINNYIIETTAIKQYKHKSKNHTLYQCMFMCVKIGGYSFGFSVTSNVILVSGNVRVIGIQSQPMNINEPSDKTPFESVTRGSEYVDYDDIRKSELDSIKI